MGDTRGCKHRSFREKELSSGRQTQRQADGHTEGWSHNLKPHLLFGLLSCLPLSLAYSLISSSLPSILLPPDKLWTVFFFFTNTHTYADTHDTTKNTSQSRSILLSQTRRWRNQPKGETDEWRGRSETGDHATLPRHLGCPSDDITAARDLHAGTVIKCD